VLTILHSYHGRVLCTVASAATLPSLLETPHERTHFRRRPGPHRQAAHWRQVRRIENHRVARRGEPRHAGSAGPRALCHADEIDAAIASAKEAFKTWKKTSIGARARIFLKYQQLIRENMAELAALLTAEQGKTLPDAEGDVFRGLEVVEHAASIGNLQLGELANNVAGGVDTYTLLQPLGVCAGITPFNFPAMIPLWMFPMAIATGNTFVLKPSEQDPMVTMRLCELAWKPASLPAC
jgi:acyl-CoA reductase-like NAD-dependent aldehyde dehydrogenase